MHSRRRIKDEEKIGKCFPCLLYLGGGYEAEHQCKFGKENFSLLLQNGVTLRFG